jgi:ribonuclease-3
MEELQKRIGYKFNDTKLLARSLTHPSLAKQENNQRLEFLGDAVIGLVVARILYDLFPKEQEGELARRQADLVRGETLAQVARDIKLGDALKVATSEIQSGGRDNPSNLEDALEALIGAIYLDGGIKAVEEFTTPRWKELAKNVTSAPKDAKTALQEWAQGCGLPLPVYKLIETVGSAHAPIFTIEVTVQGYEPATAKAASKRVAEQQAAGILLERLSKL